MAWWALAANVAAGFASSWSQSYVQKAQYDAQNIINQGNTYAQNTVNTANADAANAVRKGNNQFQAALASLQDTQRSINNKEKLSAFGDRWNAAEVNQGRILDGMVRGSLATQLKSAANLGALQAQSAARGVGGSSAAVLRSISALSYGHAQTQQADNQKYVTYDALLQKSGLLRATVNSLDQGQALPNLDYGITVAPLAQAPLNPGDYISPAGNSLVSTLLNNAGSFATMLNGLSTPAAKSSAWDLSKVSGKGANIASGLQSIISGGTYFNMA